jgi:Asp/Glu/hydantoin racemase
MRLLAITPIVVDGAELERRQRRYDALAPAGVTIVLEHLGEGPRALETEADVRASERALLARYRAVDPEGWDGYLPDCVLDPVVGLDHGLPRPVFGLGRLASAFVAGQGARLGAVARNQAIAAELDRKLAEYGLATAGPTTVLDLSVEDISDDVAWTAAVDSRVADLDCDFVLNACSAVEVAEQRRAPYLLDPTRTALAMLALRAAATGDAGVTVATSRVAR